MKKLTSLLAFAVIGSGALNAAEEAPALSGTLTTGYEGIYAFRGEQLAESILTAAADISWNGLYAGVSTYNGLEDSSPYADYNDYLEVDIYGGYNLALGDKLSLDLGVVHYTYPKLEDPFNMSGVNSLEGYVGVNFDTLLKPSLYAYYDVELETFTFEGSIGHSFALTEQLSLDGVGTLGYVGDDQDQVGERYYWVVSADLVYAFTEKANISVGARYSGSSYVSESYEGFSGNDSEAIWFGGKLSVGF